MCGVAVDEVVHVPGLPSIATLLDVREEPLVLTALCFGELDAMIDCIVVACPADIHDLFNVMCMGVEWVRTDGRLFDWRELPPVYEEQHVQATEDSYFFW